MSSLHWRHTRLSCFYIPNDGACCDPAATAFGRTSTQFAFCKVQSKLCEVETFDSFVFAFSQFLKIQFCRFCIFVFFDSVNGAPAPRGCDGVGANRAFPWVSGREMRP